jgi:hypothetical protein
MKTQGFERRFSQNLAPVGARKAPKPLLCLHFKFIQQTLSKLLVKTVYEQGAGRKNLTTDSRSPTKPIPKRSNRAGIEFPRFVNAPQK